MRLFLLIFMCFTITLFAQETVEELTDSLTTEPEIHTVLSEPVEHHIHGALVLKSTAFGPAQKLNLLTSGELAWVLNRKYLLGLGFTGLSTDVHAPQIFPIEDYLIVTNYGGLLFGYIHNSFRLIHFEGQTLVGFGQIFYRDSEYHQSYNDKSMVLAFEPTVNAVLNVTAGFRMSVGLSYRMITNVKILDLKNEDVSGLSLNLGFKVGRF